VVTSEDHCNILIEFEGGTPAAALISSVAPRAGGHWIEVAGEKQVLILGSRNLVDYGKGFHVWLGGGKSRFRRLSKESRKDDSDGRIAPFTGIARRFVQAIVSGTRDFAPSFREGYRAQLAMDAAHESSLTQRWVHV
jgi:predicted dehydrogenase